MTRIYSRESEGETEEGQEDTAETRIVDIMHDLCSFSI